MDKVFIVAEISANHNQSCVRAGELILAAKRAGADAAKLQTYTPDTMTIRCRRPEFFIRGGTPWDGRTLYSLYQDAYMPWEWQCHLKHLADEVGIELFSTPFDKTAVDFLESKVGVARYKVASFEIVDLPLIRYIASKGKPMIMSTGMATLTEIKDAVATAKGAGAVDITLLHCTSAYPAPADEANLRAIPWLKLQFPRFLLRTPSISVGFSDHTLGIAAPVAAVALGARMIEKHITLSRQEPGIDNSFSLEPDEFKEMVDAVRATEKMLGSTLGLTKHEAGSKVFRRSLFVVDDVVEGEKFTERNVRSIRPGHGLLPKHIDGVLGRKASRDIARGTPMQWGMLVE